MHRPRFSVALSGLSATLLLTPVLAATALAADPIVVVKPGDTLTSLSKRHGIAIGQLVDLNDLANPNRIYAGQRLRVAPGAATPAAPAPQARTHTVRAGEHLTGIARHYGVSISAVASANGIVNASRIYPGQRLRIPGAGPAAPAAPSSAPATAPTAPAAPRSHTVRSGEHLIGIARHYGVSVAAIVSANGIANASRIYAGQRLAIPAAAAAAAPRKKPAAPAMSASMAERVARRDGVRRMIVAEAKQQGVPAAFALAVAWQESGWQQNVVSGAGAIGVMQLMPDTARWIGEAMLGRPVNPHDTRANIAAGVRLLRHYLDRYDGDRALVLAAYYQGQGAADRHGVYAVSRPYIASISTLVRLFGG